MPDHVRHDERVLARLQRIVKRSGRVLALGRGGLVRREEMANWTTLRWNVLYHWKTVVLWGLGLGGGLVFACWLLGA